MPCNRQTPPWPSPRPRGSAFSLVELLVVIGIIAVLVGILIPVVGKMRREAHKVDTAALINTIRSAADSYHANFKAYPGPFSDDDVYNAVDWNASGRFGVPKTIGDGKSNPVTGTEQLVMALLGGLKLTSNNDVTWDRGSYLTTDTPPTLITPAGPMSLSPRNPKTYSPFLTDAIKFIDQRWQGSNYQDPMGNAANDTNLPEFVDRYPEPLPILYLRARKGAPGIIGPGYQYDLRQITGYTSMGASGNTLTHGLRDLGGTVTESAGESVKRKTTADRDKRLTGADAIPYFRVPGSALPASFAATNQGGASPRSADAYILISAGPDRIYGTMDDITSFGPVE